MTRFLDSNTRYVNDVSGYVQTGIEWESEFFNLSVCEIHSLLEDTDENFTIPFLWELWGGDNLIIDCESITEVE